MRISDWSSDVCSSDLRDGLQALVDKLLRWYPPDHEVILYEAVRLPIESPRIDRVLLRDLPAAHYKEYTTLVIPPLGRLRDVAGRARLEEHTSELQSLMRKSSAVFCLKKTQTKKDKTT